MKLLSICIPTYNRPDKIKVLFQSFLYRAIEEFGDLIEVVVCDNSDDENAKLNQAIIGNRIQYFKNDENIGFFGNLIRCVREAKEQFFWIISDDDLIYWDGFRSLMENLKIANKEKIDCLMLPINYRNALGEMTACDGNTRADLDLRTYVTTLPTVPFGYFAASVIRLDKNKLDRVTMEFKENIILNIPLFISMLNPEYRLRFLHIPIIEYIENYYVRMEIDRFYDGARDVILYLENEYRINGAKLIDHTYKEAMLMMIAHRIGFRIYLNGDASRWPLLTKLYKNLSFKTLFLAILIILPRALTKIIYLSYLSLQHARLKEKISIGEVISRYRVLHSFIKSKQNERRSTK